MLRIAVAAPAAAPKPDWTALQSFLYFLLTLIPFLGVLCVKEHVTLGTRLPPLPATWKFSDSWASNVTVVTGVLTGLLGTSDAVKGFLGDHADAAIALATVGGAVAAAFIGVAGLLVQATRTQSGAVSAGGFVAGAAVTLAGAFGELYVMYESGRTLSLGRWFAILLLIVAVILMIYAWTTVDATLTLGSGADAPVKPSEATITAVILAAKLRHVLDAGVEDEVEAVLKTITLKLNSSVTKKDAKHRLWGGKDVSESSMAAGDGRRITSADVTLAREVYARRIRSALL